jgi:hypothetical protein
MVIKRGPVIKTALVLGRFTSEDLAREAATEAQHARESIRAMRRLKLIHIAEWEHSKKCRKFVAVYQVGEGVDAVQPPTRTNAQINKAHKRETRAKLVAMFGDEVARKCLTARRFGGADAVVVDGITIFRRHEIGPTEGVKRYSRSESTGNKKPAVDAPARAGWLLMQTE